MSSINTFIKRWLIPGSMPALMLGLGLGVVLINAGPAAREVGHLLLTALAITYWLLSLPVVAGVLIGSSGRRFQTIDSPDVARGARVLVVFGNGSVHYTDGCRHIDYLTRRSVFCAFEAARLYALLRPDVLVATGGVAGQAPEARSESELLRDLLVSLGVRSDAVLAESNSRTTREQVANVVALLNERGLGGRLVVVTTSAHMPRVAALFAEAHVPIIPSVTPELRYDEGRTGWRRWYPSMAALTGSASVMYECLAGVQASVAAMRRARPSAGPGGQKSV